MLFFSFIMRMLYDHYYAPFTIVFMFAVLYYSIIIRIIILNYEK